MRPGRQPPDSLRLPPHNNHLFLTSDDDLPTPPYRAEASTSNLHAQHHPDFPSPAYVSRSNVNLNQMDEKKNDSRENTWEEKKVHYDTPSPYGHFRNDSSDMMGGHSRTASVAGTDDSDDESDYDWSGEEDLVDEEQKFEERMGVAKKKKGWGPKRIITLLFSSLIGSTFLAGVMVTPGILIHFYWYKPNPTEQRLYIKQNVQAWTFWAAANLLISWYLALLVDLVPVVFTMIVSAAWGHVSEVIKSRVELFESVKNTIKPLLYAGCGWASWVIIFESIYKLYDSDVGDRSRAPYLDRVSQVVSFFFFLTLVLCIQKMLSHMIAFSFHQTVFKERIEQVQIALSAIEKLRDYRPKHRKTGSRTPIFGHTPFSEKPHFDWSTKDTGSDADGEGEGSVSKGKKKDKGKHKRKDSKALASLASPVSESSDPYQSIGPSPLASRPMTPSNLGNGESSPHRYPPSRGGSPEHDADATIKHAAKAIKSTLLHDARNIKGKDKDLSSMVWDVNSTTEAKRLARSIFTRYRDRHRSYLIPADFYPAFHGDQDAAQAAFRVFDKDNNGDLSRPEIKTTLVKMYKERRFLSRSMRDASVALKSLDHILLFFAFVILFFISLSVFGVEVGDSLTSVYSLGIAASFIFKNAASQAFDAIMFLFVTHPYDTGDRVFIDDEVLVVKKMTLFATVFTRSDGTETYYFNSQLFNKFITNVRRSGKQFENLTMQVAWKTPTWKIDKLEELMNQWLSTESNRWFEPSTSIMFQKIEFQRYLELTMGIGHNSNWQDWGLRWQRKTVFHAAVNYYCRQLGIGLYNTPMPICYVNANGNVVPQSPGQDNAPLEGPSRPDLPELDTTDFPDLHKPALGFIPPAESRAHLLRARKSRSRKAGMRGMGADG